MNFDKYFNNANEVPSNQQRFRLGSEIPIHLRGARDRTTMIIGYTLMGAGMAFATIGLFRSLYFDKGKKE
jgi:hypothetical protein